MGVAVSLHGSNPELLMSALGHKRTLTSAWAMSALPPKADIETQSRDVRFVPKADSCNETILSLFDHLVGATEDTLRNAQSPRFIEPSPTDRLSGHSGNPALRRLSV